MSPSCTVDHFPPELLDAICAAAYFAGVPAVVPSLDPIVLNNADVPTSLPSSYPSSYWPESVARQTLSSLCLINRAWSDAAKPWLWRKVEVRLPQNWVAFVGELTAGEEELSGEQINMSINQATNTVLAIGSLDTPADEDTKKLLYDSIIASLSGPDSSIPPELLSPPASREPSPRRIRTKSKSPARWKVMQSINNALQDVVQQDGSSFYVPTPVNLHPGRHVRRIDFSHFRTIGMRRSIGEAIEHRFVTSERLESVLKESPNLAAFGATEYMDGALTLSVLKELFLRGSPSRGRGRSSRGRSQMIDSGEDTDEVELERRRECKDLVAIDFTGCVSAIFFTALRDFVHTYIVVDDAESSEDENERGDSHPHRNIREPMSFMGLQRLCLLGVKSIQPDILHPFVLSFPSLTHLDLSSTRVVPDLLVALGASDTVRLEALALARCTRLTGNSVTDFLINGRCTHGLKHLNLYGDTTYPSPLTKGNLSDLLARAPCFTSGVLEYLDLSSSPLTSTHLTTFPAQPHLRSLGLSYIPLLPLGAIADFLLARASAVEVLTLISSSPDLCVPVSGRVFNASIALHAKLIQPLCMPPPIFSVSLFPADEPEAPQDVPTHLRVLELAMPLLNGLGAGAGTWRIVRSKGGRAWYVDTACGWVAEPSIDGGSANAQSSSGLRRALPRAHPLRVAFERLADARGNVSSGMGWHSRKMEVLEGAGMLGREDGLYGAVAFAYQG